jgi:phosphate:Na+ symporter
MVKEIIFGLVGGLGLFFVGMKTMSDALRKVASQSFKNKLEAVTSRPILGVLIGTLVTALIQSSSATTVLAVGFVNAGLMTLRQAISILLGANIGTTLTAWLISFFAVFKITSYALPAIGIGYFLQLLGKTQKVQRWGQLLLGFGLLFVGLGFVKEAFGPLRESDFLKNVLATFGSCPILGVMLGMLVTIILQSSSATIALLQLMAFSGLIDFATALPIILGENIGTTITAELSAMGSGINARRTARSHALLNILGVCYMMIPVSLGWYAKLIEALIPGALGPENIMFHIALAHSVFNIFNSLVVFLPLIRVLEKLAVKLTRVRKGVIEMGPRYLEKNLLATPTLALQQSIKELIRMARIAQSALSNALSSFRRCDPELIQAVGRQEEAVDLLQKEITQYLVEISEREIGVSEAERIPVLLHSVNDIERIGDHAENIRELALRKDEQKLTLSDQAWAEVDQISALTLGMAENVLNALEEQDSAAASLVLEQEKELNRLQVELKENHVRRLNNHECHLLSGLVFIDLVDNLERIGDHLTNIAEGALRRLRWDREIEINESGEKQA